MGRVALMDTPADWQVKMLMGKWVRVYRDTPEGPKVLMEFDAEYHTQQEVSEKLWKMYQSGYTESNKLFDRS